MKGRRTKLASGPRGESGEQQGESWGTDMVVFWRRELEPAEGRVRRPKGRPGIPFEELLTPCRDRLELSLSSVAGEELASWSDGSRQALLDGWIRTAADLAAQPLLRGFRTFAAKAGGGEALTSSTDPARLYRRFVEQHLRTGLDMVLAPDAGLARRLELWTESWTDSCLELIRRLAFDRPHLERVFAGGAKLGDVTGAVPYLSDPHDGGRAVARLDFASGLRLMYKPRPMALEAAYNRLLRWLRDAGLTAPPRAVTICSRGDYGWAEYVEAVPCADETEADLYFRRAGALTCLWSVLGAVDCHAHNVRASGSHPVLLDAETLFYPFPRPVSMPERAGMEQDAGLERLGFLPRVESPASDVAYDVSGLGGGRGVTEFRVPVWSGLGTDRVECEYRPARLKDPGNRCVLDGRALSVASRGEAFLIGFSEMHRLLRAEQDSLTDPGGLLTYLRRCPRRILRRRTREYTRVLNESLRPSGLSPARVLSEIVARLRDLPTPTLGGSQEEDSAPHEAAALARLDLPRFRLACEDLPLTQDAGYQDCLIRLKALDELALDRKLSRLRVELASSLLDAP